MQTSAPGCHFSPARPPSPRPVPQCFEAAVAAEEAEQAQLRAAAEYELAVIEEARRQLLAEAASLKQYLPKFVARDEQEYKFINDMSEKFQQSASLK